MQILADVPYNKRLYIGKNVVLTKFPDGRYILGFKIATDYSDHAGGHTANVREIEARDADELKRLFGAICDAIEPELSRKYGIKFE